MIRSKCPTCSKAYEVAGIDELPTFPFCSDRCRLIDLGRWLKDDYVIPGPPVENQPEGEDDED